MKTLDEPAQEIPNKIKINDVDQLRDATVDQIGSLIQLDLQSLNSFICHHVFVKTYVVHFILGLDEII